MGATRSALTVIHRSPRHGQCGEIFRKGDSQFEAMVLLKLKAKVHAEMQ